MSSEIPVHSQQSFLCSLLICRKWNHDSNAKGGSLVSEVSARILGICNNQFYKAFGYLQSLFKQHRSIFLL